MNNIDERPYLERTKNGMSFSGTDVNIPQAYALAGSIKLYIATGMLPKRGFGITKMMKLAGQITGKSFKRTETDKAIKALEEYANTLKHLPANVADIQ